MTSILEHQAAWAEANGLELNSNKTAFVNASSALFVELSPETIDDLRRGAGSELKRIHSLRSSSCLALNVFEPWRRSPRALQAIFGVPIQSLRFEAKQPTGLKGEAPHLDVLLAGSRGSVGIESKFLETYDSADNGFADSYFRHEGLWEGLENSRKLAVSIAEGSTQFRWLHAAQLIKHALGLSKNQLREFRLVMLWYRQEGPITEDIEEEIGQFARAISDDFDFTSITYQELCQRLGGLDEPLSGYLHYLRDRYRLGTEWSRRLPLLEQASQPEVNQRSLLAETIKNLEPDLLATAYARTVEAAPQRPLRDKPFIVGHDGGGGAASVNSEKVVAKALFNHEGPLELGDRSVTILDYEVPLRAYQADGGVGEIDLLGIERETGRPWIFELKVSPNSETPLKALLQVLRYSAIVDANRRRIARELGETFGLTTVVWPAVMAVAADHDYWQQMLATEAAGPWLSALERFCLSLQERLAFEIALIDLGQLDVALVEGRAHLVNGPYRMLRLST